MKDKILVFIIGLLIGAVVTASGFLIYEKNNKSTTQNQTQGQMMERPNGETPPEKPSGNGGGPGGNGGSSNVSHTGETEISSDTTTSGKTYSSETGSQNALLVTGGTSTLTNPTITKTGDSYVTSLNNEVADNSNINFNGYKLYVNGTAIN